jgi:RecA-family ATPase
MTTTRTRKEYPQFTEIIDMPDIPFDGGKDKDNTPPPPPLPWIDMSNWDNEPIPEQDWAVLNRIPLRQCVLFSGEGAAGKSTVELHRSAAHAMARDWLGTMPEPGPAFYIDAEEEKDVLHRRLGAIIRHYIANGSVVLVSHPSLTGINSDTGISGSTQWHNAVGARYYMKSPKPKPDEQPDSDLREIVFKKNQYGPVSANIVLRYSDGMFLPLPGVGTLDKLAAEQKADEVFLVILARFTNQNINVSHSLTSNNAAPKLFAAEQEAKQAGIGKEALTEAMRRLLKDGKIKNVGYGPPSKCWQKLVIATGEHADG